MTRRISVTTLLLFLCGACFAQISPPRMIQMPDIHGDKVVFVAEGDIWLGDLVSKQAYRATTHEGEETSPKFSPDGTEIAFSASYDGGRDVYVMPVRGGIPRRVTFDPAGAEMVDWTPDGSSILFRSSRCGPGFYTQLFLVDVDGGLPRVLPMEKASRGSFSSDGKKLAYTKIPRENNSWKRYRGGQAQGIWIANLTENSFRRINNETVYEEYPVWLGDSIYYISEKDGSANVWEYDSAKNKCVRVTSHKEYDARFPSTDGKRIIYQWGQDLFVYDPIKKTDNRVELSLTSDKIHARPYLTKGQIGSFELGPTGKRIVSEFRGQVFSLPVTEGEIHTIYSIPGVRAKEPTWSPDGKWIAIVSDANGEENIWLAPSSGRGEPKQLTSSSKAFISGLVWSPDSSKIMFVDTTQKLRMVEVLTGRTSEIATGYYQGVITYDFSPDSKWIAYIEGLNNFSTCIWLYNIGEKKATRVSSKVVRASDIAWDPDGKYLYYLAQTSIDPQWDGFDFQLNIKDTTKIFAIPLAIETGTPMPISNEEETTEEPEEKSEENKVTKIDLDDIGNRAIELPVSGSNYSALSALSGEVLYLDDGVLFSFNFAGKEESQIAKGVNAYSISADRKRLAIKTSQGVLVGDAGAPIGPNSDEVDASDWVVTINPELEWKQMLNEAWRVQRDTFYDENHHGMNWDEVGARYEKMVPAIGTRQDLNRIIGEMIGEMNVSHEFVGGGSTLRKAPAQPGMGALGAELKWDEKAGAYQFSKIFRGDDYDLEARSPLLTPGNGIKVGDYIFSINGKELTKSKDPNSALVGLAGKIITVEVGSTPEKDSARSVRIRAMGNDEPSRYLDWVTSNREYVRKNGGDNLAYIHIPDMGEAGMKEFAKEFYANLDKDGFIIDVRDNQGGIISGMILERFKRVIFEYDQSRHNAPQPYHRTGFLSKLVLICNEGTSSDGEYFSTGWRQMNLGPSVGMRTWGGYMAVGGFSLVDGGFVSCPQQGSFSPEGKWLPDGTGFMPDFEVIDDPNAFVKGRDLQLDKALDLLKAQIRKDPPKWPKRMIPPSQEKAFPPNKGGG